MFPNDFVFATFSTVLRAVYMLRFSHVTIREPMYLAFSAFMPRPSLASCGRASFFYSTRFSIYDAAHVLEKQAGQY
jgi:hypothetical protein